MTFQQALDETAQQKRHLLLGNGFSIALFPEFRYGSLLDEANFEATPHLRQAFDRLGTADFELVIRALLDTATLAPLYGGERYVQNIRDDADRLKDLLVEAIAGSHPDRPSAITEHQFSRCREFLANFVGVDRGRIAGQVYTLSYDLLLYWTLLHTDGLEGGVELSTDDGFRAPQDEPDAPVVVWDGEEQFSQCIHFLHGGLHLFDRGAELSKICWQRAGGRPLVDQIREALNVGRFPLFVAEATSQHKLDRIRHSAYLHRSLKSFAGICKQAPQALFIFGHALHENDQHVLRWIARGRIAKVYVSLFEDPLSDAGLHIIGEVERWARLRPPRYPLEVSWFDAREANPWGGGLAAQTSARALPRALRL